MSYKVNVLLLFLLSGCAKFSIFKSTVEYKIDATRDAVTVRKSNGDVIGQTPILLSKEDTSDSIEGKFVTLYLEKEGFIPRVIMFPSSESLQLSINLESDKNFNEKRYYYQNLLINRLEKSLKEKTKLNTKLLHLAGLIDKREVEAAVYKKNLIAEEKDIKVKAFATMPKKKSDSRDKSLSQQSTHKLETLKNTVDLPKKITKVKEIKMVQESKVVEINKNNLKSRAVASSHPITQVKYKTKVKKVTKYIYKKYPIEDLLMVQFLILNKEIESAKYNIMKLEKDHPNVSEIYSIYAYIELTTGNVLKAKTLLNRSLRLNKDDKLAIRLKQFI